MTYPVLLSDVNFAVTRIKRNLEIRKKLNFCKTHTNISFRKASAIILNYSVWQIELSRKYSDKKIVSNGLILYFQRKANYGFRLPDPLACKHLWKCAVEHVAFYR